MILRVHHHLYTNPIIVSQHISHRNNHILYTQQPQSTSNGTHKKHMYDNDGRLHVDYEWNSDARNFNNKRQYIEKLQRTPHDYVRKRQSEFHTLSRRGLYLGEPGATTRTFSSLGASRTPLA